MQRPYPWGAPQTAIGAARWRRLSRVSLRHLRARLPTNQYRPRTGATYDHLWARSDIGLPSN